MDDSKTGTGDEGEIIMGSRPESRKYDFGVNRDQIYADILNIKRNCPGAIILAMLLEGLGRKVGIVFTYTDGSGKREFTDQALGNISVSGRKIIEGPTLEQLSQEAENWWNNMENN